MKISISGLSGSGKTTLARNLSSIFSLELFSAGRLFREYAKEKNISIEELSKHAPEHLDRVIDAKTQQICKNNDNFVIEGRLTIFFCPSSIKIYLYAPIEIRAQRMSERENMGFEEALNYIVSRDNEDMRRYRAIYGIEDYDKVMRETSHLCIDTSKHGVEEMTQKSVNFIRNHLFQE